ncbi:MAG: hypothetical protein DRJ10_01240 [Bacteroidetes bacterium]|nr:MAG: hypothetical protein DRJ10_01240 [Bacteroidota bacterium]
MEENDIRVKLYRCSEDGEADYPVKPVNKSKIKLEIPPDHYGQVVLERFLTENSYASPQEIKL